MHKSGPLIHHAHYECIFWYCQVNLNPFFFGAKSIRANTINQQLRWYVDQWNLNKIS